MVVVHKYSLSKRSLHRSQVIGLVDKTLTVEGVVWHAVVEISEKAGATAIAAAEGALLFVIHHDTGMPYKHIPKPYIKLDERYELLDLQRGRLEVIYPQTVSGIDMVRNGFDHAWANVRGKHSSLEKAIVIEKVKDVYRSTFNKNSDWEKKLEEDRSLNGKVARLSRYFQKFAAATAL